MSLNVLFQTSCAGEEQTDLSSFQRDSEPFPAFLSILSKPWKWSLCPLRVIPASRGIRMDPTQFCPWAAPSAHQRSHHSLGTGRKEQDDFLGCWGVFLIVESITLPFTPVSKSSAFHVGSVGINLEVLLRSPGRHSCKSTRTCKSPQRAVRAWLSLEKSKIYFFLKFFFPPQMCRSFLSFLEIPGSFLKISICHVLVLCSCCAAIWW